MSYRVRDLNPEDSQDAQKMADLFNDFDSSWPGGFLRGMQVTPERIQERLRRTRRLAACVVESEAELVGYCDLEAQPGQTEMAYVPLLGARLAHHGRGVGKMLLREMIQRTTNLGFREITLGTWPGNTKAVPLYKKTGFFWAPDTNVWMRNFLPTILTLPLAKAFFAERDWYNCLERELTLAPDDIKWKGMQVFPYHFRDGEDYLDLVIEAASGGLTGIRTPDFSVSCVIPVEEAAAGETCPITWEIVPGEGKLLEVALLAEGEAGLEVRVQEKLVVESAISITRDLRILPDTRPRRGGQTPHRVRSMLLVNGQPLPLETGVKVVQPIEIQYGGQAITVGRQEKITVRLRSRLDKAVSGAVALDAHPALSAQPPAKEFSLAPRSWTQCEFQLKALQPGVIQTHLRLEGGMVPQARPIVFRAFRGGEVLASVDTTEEELATLETPGLQVQVQLRGGGMAVQHSAAGGRDFLHHPMAELGPPFMDWRMRPPLQAVRADHTLAGPTLVNRAPSLEFPGLIVERALSLIGSELVQVEYSVFNTTGTSLPAQLQVTTWIGDLDGFLALPLPGGLIREPLRGWGDFPSGDMDAIAPGTALEENWAACEERELVCGLVWQGSPEQQVQWSYFPSLVYNLGEIPPHSVQSLPTLYLVAAGGNWKTVRHWWRRLVQSPGVHEGSYPEPSRVLDVHLEPSPALLCRDTEEVQVQVLNRRGRKLSGSLLITGEEFQVQPTDHHLETVDRDHPFTANLQVESPPAPAAGFLHAVIDKGLETSSFKLPVIRLGSDSGECIIRQEEDSFVMENGLLTLRVAPHLLGSLHGLETKGVNHLSSAYPTPRPFQGINPWFGGVHPILNWGRSYGQLSRETFNGETVERVGERGLHWKGVRVSCQPAHKDLCWLGLEVEYLILPGSSLVCIVSRWTNRTTARMGSQGGISVWPAVGGQVEGAVGHWEQEGERRRRREGPFSFVGYSSSWAAVENPDTGETLLLVATDPHVHPSLEDQEEGFSMESSGSWNMGPGESKEIVNWLVLCSDISQVEVHSTLAKVERVP